MGHLSIYILSSIISIMSLGLMMIYFIVFGDIMSSIVSDLVYDGRQTPDLFFTQRSAYIIILGASLFPLVIKKELNELKIASVILFIGISSFILIFTYQIVFEGIVNNDEAYYDYFTISKDLGVIKGISIMIVAFGFQQNLFPMYNSLAV